MVCAVAVAAVSRGDAVVSARRSGVRNTGWAMTVAAVAGFATTRLLGRQTTKQIQQTTVDLKSQFEAMQKAISMPKPQFIQMNLVD